VAKYSPIWHTIKAAGSAEVSVSKGNARTVKTGVIDSKKHENAVRKMAGLPRYPKLVITETSLSDYMVKIKFELLYSIKL